MQIRDVKDSELNELLNLYTHLHETEIPNNNAQLAEIWNNIVNDKNHHIIVCLVDGKIVSSCVCVIIPNLTHNQQPYAFIENVITDIEYRKRGLATACLNYAREIAKK
ncbi:MAG: GNAT family N-acetyltransferase, partial [Ruminococcus sp.]|nr:GNAT family N-acetyltransferase [Ruminococcus sp.]